MLFLLNIAAATAPADEPGLRPGLDPSSVTPGTLGFVFTALIVVAVIFLIRDMTKRIRRVRYRAEAEALEAERRDARGPDGDSLPTDERGN